MEKRNTLFCIYYTSSLSMSNQLIKSLNNGLTNTNSKHEKYQCQESYKFLWPEIKVAVVLQRPAQS